MQDLTNLIAQTTDPNVRMALRFIQDGLVQLNLGLLNLQRNTGKIALTPAQLSQIKAALEAAGSHPLQLTGLTASGLTSFAKAANEWLDSFNAATGVFTGSQPSAANLSNGTTGTGAVVLAGTPTLVTPNIGAATGTSLNLGGTGVLATTAATGTGALVHAGGATLTTATLDAATSASITNLPVYANNAAAITGGLVAGNLYRTGADPDFVAVVH